MGMDTRRNEMEPKLNAADLAREGYVVCPKCKGSGNATNKRARRAGVAAPCPRCHGFRFAKPERKV